MNQHWDNVGPPARFERGVAVISLDTEQVWGYADTMDEDAFDQPKRAVAGWGG